MSFELAVWLILGGIAVVVIAAVAFKKVPKKLKVDQYTVRWQELQSFCKDKTTWRTAVIEADRLLDSALKRRKFNGKSMGERMVSAQRSFTNNDTAWYAHNLCKKVLTDPDARLREQDVKNALVGFRQALRDLGALPNGESRNAE